MSSKKRSSYADLVYLKREIGRRNNKKKDSVLVREYGTIRNLMKGIKITRNISLEKQTKIVNIKPKPKQISKPKDEPKFFCNFKVKELARTKDNSSYNSNNSKSHSDTVSELTYTHTSELMQKRPSITSSQFTDLNSKSLTNDANSLDKSFHGKISSHNSRTSESISSTFLSEPPKLLAPKLSKKRRPASDSYLNKYQ